MRGRLKLLFTIKTRFWLAAFILSAIVIGDGLYMYTQLEKRVSLVSYVNDSGRQRMLAVTVVSLAGNLVSETVTEARAQIRKQLNTTVGGLLTAHEKMEEQLTASPSGIAAVDLQDSMNVERIVHPFVEVASRLASAPDISLTHENPDYLFLINSIDTVVAYIEAETARLQKFAEGSVLNSYRAKLLATGAFFLVLVVLLLFVFRPMLSSLRYHLRALEVSETLYRTVLDTMGDGLVTLNEQGLIESFNKTAEQLFGYRADEVTGKNVSMLMPEPERSMHDGYLQNYLDTGKASLIGAGSREVMAMRSDGRVFPIELSVSEAWIGKKRIFTGVIRDISNRREAENRLQESESRLALAIDSMPDGFVLCDADDRILLYNRKFRRMHPNSRDLISIGRSFEDFLRQGTERGEYPESNGRIDEWVAEYMLECHSGGGTFNRQGIGGRFFAISIAQLPGRGWLGIYSDITESKNTEKKLRRARQAAEQANKEKSQFLANMSHELRTPLNAVLGYSQLLQQELKEAGQEVFVPDMQKINDSGRHLLALINDVLDLSKIEVGSVQTLSEEFTVAELIADVTSAIQPLAEQKGIRLAVEGAGDVGVMHSDKRKIRQMLMNLLENAVKFTEEGDIGVDVRRKTEHGRDWVIFNVHDTGIGMNAEQMNVVFDAFKQADASTTRKHGGTGLGLTICKRYCELLGGDIHVESMPGMGSTFNLRLPAREAEPVAGKVVEMPPDRVVELFNGCIK